MVVSTRILVLAAVALCLAFASPASAIPSLQLGPGTGSWTYDGSTQTWVTTDNPLELVATANATTGNGSYAWDAAGAGNQIAYLVVSAVPMTTFDNFDITISNDGGALPMYTSGVGAPPIEDPNSLAPHGIFDTYFEIYQFDFDGAVTTIGDTQPGGSGVGDGFLETFNVVINSNGGDALHFDLFTVIDDGILALGSGPDKTLVSEFAPFSHDAQTNPIPEPSSALLFSAGMLVAGRAIRRR